MPIDVATWRQRMNFLPRFSRMKSPAVATWPCFSHASLNSIRVHIVLVMSVSASAASTAAVILPPSSSPSAHTTVTPTISDIAMELNLRERKKLNVVVFGLSPGPNDMQAFEDLVQNELGIKPHITKSSRPGKGTGGNPPPLLICLRDETD